MPDPLTIGLLGGTGPQGRGLALRMALAGHRVLLGSRDPARAAGIVADLLDGRDLPVEGVGNPDAAAKADVVFLVFPYAGQADVLPDLAGPIGGKVVVDVINPLAGTTRAPTWRRCPRGSAAEQAAALLPQARVVAAFHHAAPKLLADPERQVETDVLVASDDPEAKGLVLGRPDPRLPRGRRRAAAAGPPAGGVHGGDRRDQPPPQDPRRPADLPARRRAAPAPERGAAGGGLVRIYTRRGDDGTTGLLYGGRVDKSDQRTEAYGTTDEAVAALGMARVFIADSILADLVLRLQRELFVAGAELATASENSHKLTPARPR